LRLFSQSSDGRSSYHIIKPREQPSQGKIADEFDASIMDIFAGLDVTTLARP
jgi:hypothetical protein